MTLRRNEFNAQALTECCKHGLLTHAPHTRYNRSRINFNYLVDKLPY